MTERPLETAWRSFQHVFVPDDAPAAQITAMRNAFYAGAIRALAYRADHSAALMAEIDEFLRDKLARASKGTLQ